VCVWREAWRWEEDGRSSASWTPSTRRRTTTSASTRPPCRRPRPRRGRAPPRHRGRRCRRRSGAPCKPGKSRSSVIGVRRCNWGLVEFDIDVVVSSERMDSCRSRANGSREPDVIVRVQEHCLRLHRVCMYVCMWR
jgi:hypothetical protein